MALIQYAAPWDRQPQEAAQASPDWLRVYNFAQQGVDATGAGAAFSPGTLTYQPSAAGVALKVNANGQASAGEQIPGISDGLTVVFIAEKYGDITASDFLFGDFQPTQAAGIYNFGFYESSSTYNISFFLHNGTTGVNSGNGTAWTNGAGPQVWVATYGDGDNNVRLYLNGAQVASAAQTGSVRRDSSGKMASTGWNAGAPNFGFYAGAVSGRCMSAAEVAEKFGSVRSAWSSLFVPQTIWVPVSAGGGTVTLAAQDAAHAHALDNAALSIGVTLTVADLAHGHALDASTLSTGTALTVADAQHAHALDNVTLSTTGATSLTVADLLHAHTLDAVVLTSQTDLAAADMAHGHALDGVTLTLGGISLVIAEIMHAHALDNVALTLDTYLAVADILHAHTIDNVLVSIPGGTLDLILKILVNRQELNPATGTFTLYDDDGVTVLYTTSAWADAAGTVSYSGGALRRIDALF